MADKITSIYEKACAKGILDPKTQSEEWFRNQISTESGMKSFYDHATANGMKFHPYPEFKERLTQPVETPAQPAQPVSQATQPLNPSVKEHPAPTTEEEYQRNLEQQDLAQGVATQRPPRDFGNVQLPSMQIPTFGNDATTTPQAQQAAQRVAIDNSLAEANDQRREIARQIDERRPMFDQQWNGTEQKEGDVARLDRVMKEATDKANKAAGQVANEYNDAYRYSGMPGGTRLAMSGEMKRAYNQQVSPDVVIDAFNKSLDEDYQRALKELELKNRAQGEMKMPAGYKMVSKPMTEQELADMYKKAGIMSPEDFSLYRQYVQEKLQEKFASMNVPQNKMDYFVNKFMQSNLIAQLASLYTQTPTQRALKMQGTAQYEQEHDDFGTKAVGFGAEVAGLLADPAMIIMPIAGGAAGNALVRGVAGHTLTKMGYASGADLARRAMVQQGILRTAGRLVGSAFTFAGIDATHDVVNQLYQPVWNAETGQWEQADWNAWQTAQAAAKGAITGTLFGATGLLGDHVQHVIGDSWNKTAGLIAGKTTHFVGGTNAMVATSVASKILNGEQINWGEEYAHAAAMQLVFDIQGGVRSLGKVYSEAAKNGKKISLPEAVRTNWELLKQDPYKGSFTKEEIEQFNKAGFEGDDAYSILRNLNGGKDFQSLNDLYSALDRIAEDPTIDTQAKYRLASLVFGKIEANVRPIEVDAYQDEQGRYVVRTYDNACQTYETRYFDSEQKAQEYRQQQYDETRGNLKAWQEGVIQNYAFAQDIQRMADDAIVEIQKQYPQYSKEQLYAIMREAMLNPHTADRSKAIASDTDADAIRGMFEAYLNEHKPEIFDAVGAIRKQTADDFGISASEVRDILGKDYRDLDMRQRGIYDDYISRLRDAMPKPERSQQDPQAAETDALPQGGGPAGPQDRQMQLRQRAAAEAQKEVESIAHEDGNVYRVGIKGRDGVMGYAFRGDLGLVEGEDGYSTSGRGLVTVKMTDGTVKQVPADEIQLLDSPASAQDRLQAITDHLFAKYANEDLFHVGDKVTIKQNGQVAPYTSTITAIDDAGVHVEVDDGQGGVMDMPIPHETAAEQLTVVTGETEDGIVTYNMNGTELRLRDLGNGEYETIVADGEQPTRFSEADLAQVGATRVEKQPEGVLNKDAGSVLNSDAPVEPVEPAIKEPNVQTMTAPELVQSAIEFMESKPVARGFLLAERAKINAQLEKAIKDEEKGVTDYTSPADYKAKVQQLALNKLNLQQQLAKLDEAIGIIETPEEPAAPVDPEPQAPVAETPQEPLTQQQVDAIQEAFTLYDTGADNNVYGLLNSVRDIAAGNAEIVRNVDEIQAGLNEEDLGDIDVRDEAVEELRRRLQTILQRNLTPKQEPAAQQATPITTEDIKGAIQFTDQEEEKFFDGLSADLAADNVSPAIAPLEALEVLKTSFGSEVNDKLLDYIGEHYPTQATISGMTDSLQGRKEREAMKNDTKLAELRAQLNAEADAKDADVQAVIDELRPILEKEGVTAQEVADAWKRAMDMFNKYNTQEQQTPEAKLAAAEAETDTNPTEAQKKAENYKQGHVTLWGLPITIENPKGSTRRGTDANGKKWEQLMHNTYGKIRRTEGVDGDHIDVFLGPNLNSERVFVVDQLNQDTGEFDEHKVMLGFDSIDEAQAAYMSNYEEGWRGMGPVTEVTMDEFKKWIDSSHRKTKPFNEYKNVKQEGAASGVTAEPVEPEQPAEVPQAEPKAEEPTVLEKAQNRKREKEVLKRIAQHEKELGVKINVVRDADELPASQGNAKKAIKQGVNVAAWYDKETKEVYAYLPNIRSAEEMTRKVFHEIVAHKGLRALVGEENFIKLCDSVWKGMSDAAKAVKIAYVYDYSRWARPEDMQKDKRTYNQLTDEEKAKVLASPDMTRLAADEYMADIAEKVSKLAPTDNSERAMALREEWERICDEIRQYFQQMFNSDVVFTDEDIAYMIVASYSNLQQQAQQQAQTPDAHQSDNPSASTEQPMGIDNKTDAAPIQEPSQEPAAPAQPQGEQTPLEKFRAMVEANDETQDPQEYLHTLTDDQVDELYDEVKAMQKDGVTDPDLAAQMRDRMSAESSRRWDMRMTEQSIENRKEHTESEALRRYYNDYEFEYMRASARKDPNVMEYVKRAQEYLAKLPYEDLASLYNEIVRLQSEHDVPWILDRAFKERSANMENAGVFDYGMKNQGEIPEAKANKPRVVSKDWTANDELRPVLNGVYHDPTGVGVVTNAHILLATPTLFDQSQEGKIILKDGTEQGGKFPNWEGVADQARRTCVKEATVDWNDIRNFIAGIKAKMKEEGEPYKKDRIANIAIRMPDGQVVIYRMRMLIPFAEAAATFGGNTIHYSPINGQTYFENGGSFGLIMPVSPESFKESVSRGYTDNYYYDLQQPQAAGATEAPATQEAPQAESKPATRKKNAPVQQKQTPAADVVETPAPKNTEKIEDVGEKIGGARKDIVQDTVDRINLNGETFSKIFPKFDYRKLIANGMDPKLAAGLKYVCEHAKTTYKLRKKRFGEKNALEATRFVANYAKGFLLGDTSLDFSSEGWVFTAYGKRKYEFGIQLWGALRDAMGDDMFDIDLTGYDCDIIPTKEELEKEGKRSSMMGTYYRTVNGESVEFTPRYEIRTPRGSKLFTAEEYDQAVQYFQETVTSAVNYQAANPFELTVYRKRGSDDCCVHAKIGGKWVEITPWGKEYGLRYREEHRAELQEMAQRKAEELKEQRKTQRPEAKVEVKWFPGTEEQPGEYRIATKVGKEYVPISDPMQPKDIWRYAREHHDELQAKAQELLNAYLDEQEANKGWKPQLNLGGIRNRIGTDWRNGQDVTAERFRQEFGFRGVEFGNYVTQKERQQILNECFDALRDMAEILGVSPRALSLNGQLGFAIGARGRSGAKAHYEPAKNVINLTKKNGWGSLAHEWWHAMDYYFGKREKERPATGGTYNDNVRKEMQDAFAAVMKAINGSDYLQRSQNLDAKTNKHYYAEETELGARAFEDFIGKQLIERGQVNDFLSHHTVVEEWNGDITNYPYPIDKDGTALAEAFQSFFDTVEEREDAATGNSVLFSVTDNKYAQFAITQANNPMVDDVHTGIRSVEDIHTLEETLNDKSLLATEPDWTEEDIRKAIADNQVTVYSSKPIKDGTFVTPSRMTAEDYAGGEGVFEKTVTPDKVAWIASDEGQYADTDHFEGDILFSISNQNNDIFYSNAERAVDGIKQDKATPEQWKAMIEKNGGLKAGEDKWLGLSEWLSQQRGEVSAPQAGETPLEYARRIQQERQKHTITKQQILDYIREHKIQIEETEYGDVGPENSPTFREFQNEVTEMWTHQNEMQNARFRERMDDIIRFEDDMQAKYGDDWQDLMDEHDRQLQSWLQDRRDELDLEVFIPEQVVMEEMCNRHGDDFQLAFDIDMDGHLTIANEDAAGYYLDANPINETRLAYTTEGLQNKREIALTVPTIDSWNEDDKIHFGDADEGKAVCWARFGDTTVKRALTDEEKAKLVSELPTADQWIKWDGSNFVNRHDIYSMPGTNKMQLGDFIYNKNDKFFIEMTPAKQRRYGSFPFESTGYDTLEEAVNAYNQWRAEREIGKQTKMEKILVIDEIQSKRHQEGREHGYRMSGEEARKEKERLKAEYNAAKERGDEEAMNTIASRFQYLSDVDMGVVYDEDRKKVPNAPFEKNWHELAMKRILRFAAENGYDKVAWTTGDQQAARYDIGKFVDSIEARPWKGFEGPYTNPEETHITINASNETLEFDVDKDGIVVLGYDSESSEYKGKNLSDIVGKDVARKLLTGEEVRLSGDGLRIGGEGMKGFYDDMLPRFMQKYGKKWGATVGTVTMPDLEDGYQTMHSVDVTDEMVNSVMEGQPMFSITPKNPIEVDDELLNNGYSDESPVLFSIAYHGSAEDFSNFLTEKIGTGEGSQTFGYGLYFTQAKEIAKDYAVRQAKEKNNAERAYYEGEQLNLEDPQTDLDYVARALQHCGLGYRDNTHYNALNIAKNWFEVNINYNKQRAEFQKKNGATKAQQEYEDEVALYERALAYINENGLPAIEFHGDRHLYEVSIPDDNGKNYLQDGTSKVRDVRRLVNVLSDEQKEHIASIPVAKFTNGTEIVSKDDIEGRIHWLIKNAGWKDLYEAAEIAAGSPKGASELLNKAGFVGIKYYAGQLHGLNGAKENTLNYVIFNDDDIEITDHVLFSITGVRGAENMDRADGVTTRMDNLEIARNMEQDKKDAKAIKWATGWERGADGLWRYEIPDLQIKSNVTVSKDANSVFRLPDLIDAPDLFKAYPEMRDYRVTYTPNMPLHIGGKFSNPNRWIYMNALTNIYERLTHQNKAELEEIRKQLPAIDDLAAANRVLWNTDPNDKEAMDAALELCRQASAQLKGNPLWDRYRELDKQGMITEYAPSGEDVLAHEIQHAIQYIEGFSRGSNLEDMEMQREYRRQSIAKLEQRIKDLEAQLPKPTEQWTDEHDAISKQIEDAERDILNLRNMNVQREAYNNAGGEVESRNVQARMKLTPEERRERLLSETEDVAREDQVFLFHNTFLDTDYAIPQSDLDETKNNLKSIATQENRERAEQILKDIPVEDDDARRDAIFKAFNAEDVKPIGVVPMDLMGYVKKYLGNEIHNYKVYTSEAYFIDHWLNHHSNIEVDEFDFLQNILSDPKGGLKYNDNNKSLCFVKKLNDRWYCVSIQSRENGDGIKLAFMNMMSQRGKESKKPYASLPDVRLNAKSEGDNLPSTASMDSSIGDATYVEPSRSLSDFDFDREGTTNNPNTQISGQENAENLQNDAENASLDANEVSDDQVLFSIRQEPAPAKTGIGYKVFYRGKDGKLYPPMVANPNGADTPVGVWLNADAAQVAGTSKTGRPQVKAGGKGTQGGSGQLAYRPGWHLGEIPYALQFNRKDENGEKTLFPKDFVWAEVEYAADNDYQQEAESYGMTENSKYRHSYAGLPRIPKDGFYMYRTNPNPETDPWIITGAMKVNRVLTNDEVDELVRKAGREPQRREGEPQDPVKAWEQANPRPEAKADETTIEFARRLQEWNKKRKEVVQAVEDAKPSYDHDKYDGVLFSVNTPTNPDASVYENAKNRSENNRLRRESAAITDMLIKLSKDNFRRTQEALRKINGDLKTLRRSMQLQAKLDKRQVEELLHLYQQLIENTSGWARPQDMPYTTEHIFNNIVNAIGKEDITDEIYNILDYVSKAQRTAAREQWYKLRTTELSKLNISGVVTQGKVAIQGQHAIKALNEALSKESGMTLKDLVGDIETGDEGLIGRMMEEEDKATSESLKLEYKGKWIGYTLAAQHMERMEQLNSERKELLADLRAAESNEHLKPFVKAELIERLKHALLDNEIAKSDAYMQSTNDLQDYVTMQTEKAKGFLQNLEEHSRRIRQMAADDLGRIQADPLGKDRKNSKIIADISDWQFAPSRDMQSILRFLGLNSPDGKGALYNHFFYNYQRAADTEFKGIIAATDTMGKKVAEIFGKGFKSFEDVGRLCAKESKRLQLVLKDVFDGVNNVDIPISVDNALYIYAVNKMADGRDKLLAMNIDQTAIDELVKDIDPRLIQLVDWVQNEFFTQLRERYNPTHEALYGAPMDKIENYFPLRIARGSLQKNVDVAEDENDASRLLPGTSTGAIKRRTKNSKPLDILKAGFLTETVRHITQMEKWNAFAQWTRDTNILLSDILFRERVKAVNSYVYGESGDVYSALKKAMQMANGTYKSVKESGSSFTLNVAKGATSAKINFRVWTAMKQMASHPAVIPYLTNAAAWKEYGKLMINPYQTLYGARAWALETLPAFQKRISKRDMGDMRLMRRAGDWEWQRKILEASAKYGMACNMYVDTLTCAHIAKVAYEGTKADLLAKGYTEEQAEEKALLEAEIAFNTSQQSSEAGYMAPVQQDRTWNTVVHTVFRVSPIQYTREWLMYSRNIGRKMQKGSKERMVNSKMRFYQMDGMTAEQARKAAETDYRKSIAKDIAGFVVYGWLMNAVWRLMAAAPYLLLGDDDDEKKKLIKRALTWGFYASPITGLFWGGSLESALDRGDVSELFDKEMPVTSDITKAARLIKGGKGAEVASTALNILVQSTFGWDVAQMTENVADAVMIVKSDQDMDNFKKARYIMHSITSVPKSQLEQVLIDNAVKYANEHDSKYNVIAKKNFQPVYDKCLEDYIEYYSVHQAPLTFWARSDENEQKMRENAEKKYRKLLRERGLDKDKLPDTKASRNKKKK